ncbi:hypothetical protein LTR85_005020 [Meristemomyces frigidus]|nr:hypothetical protein LTR85_005020 [Meristemomyces frigidus]
MKLTLCLVLLFRLVHASHNATRKIIAAAEADGITLFSLPFAAEALAEIQAIYDLEHIDVPSAVENATRVDTHAHVVPPWYQAVVPFAGQVPTPNWTLEDHLGFMANYSIGHSVLSISAPGSVVYPGSEVKSVALARLLNEYLVALVRKVPAHFFFFAVTPLPYTDAAITEISYALGHLGAAGVGLLSNHEGYYLGNVMFKAFFTDLDARDISKEVVFVHPNGPCLHAINGSLIDANPTVYPEGIAEFYFETARTFMDLTITQTIINFTSINWIVPHGGGAFPSIEDRFIDSQPAGVVAASNAAYSTRLFWDAAGPVFPHQVQGLLAYGVPPSQLLFGTDYPYAHFPYALQIATIENATFLTASEKVGLFAGNSKTLFAS